MNSQRTHWVYGWVHCGQIDGYFLKELFVSGSGTWWALFERNSQRTHWVLSKSYLVGTLVGTFEKYPPLTHWVKVGRIVSEPTMYSAWTHWVIDPLPPVWEDCVALFDFSIVLDYVGDGLFREANLIKHDVLVSSGSFTCDANSKEVLSVAGVGDV